MKAVTRYPRPQGTTYLAQAYHSSTDPKQKKLLKDKLTNLTITHYLVNNYQINNHYINTDQLATYLNTSLLHLTVLLKERLEVQDRLMGNDTLGALTRASLLGSLKMAWHASSLATQQAELLLMEQGGKYVPFLTGQANAAIANMYQSMNPLLQLIKIGMPTPAPNASFQANITNIQANAAQVNNHLIGPDEANKLIETQIAQYGIGTPTHLALLGTRDDLQNLPNIHATKASEEQYTADLGSRSSTSLETEIDPKVLRDHIQSYDEATEVPE